MLLIKHHLTTPSAVLINHRNESEKKHLMLDERCGKFKCFIPDDFLRNFPGMAKGQNPIL